MTVALIKLASLGPDSGRVGRAIGVFPYMLIRENSDCYAARVNEVQMVSIFAQDNYLAKGTKLSPGLKKYEIYILPSFHPNIRIIRVEGGRGAMAFKGGSKRPKRRHALKAPETGTKSTYPSI